MIRYIILLLSCFCLLLSTGLAQSYYFRGIMGDGLAIQMQLDFQANNVTGTYYYDSNGLPISLIGSLDGSKLSLEEYQQLGDERDIRGTFLGYLSDSENDFIKRFSGEWVNPYGNLFQFSLNKIADYVSIDIEQDRISLHSRYPYFVDFRLEPINRLLQETFIQRQFDFLHEGQDMLKAGEIGAGWLLDSDTRIIYSSADGLVSLLETIYAYTGGAHGNSGFVAHNLLIEAGGIRILDLRDMFLPRSNFMALLGPLILEDLRRQGAAWVLDGTVTALQEPDLQTFSLSPRGLVFYFEPYLMGPFSQGSFEVFMPYEPLQSLIHDSSPVYRFLDIDLKD